MKHDELIKITKKISGSLIFIGSEDKKIINSLNNNKNLTKVDILNNISNKKSKEKGKTKTISIYKFRKIFKKKKTTTLIYDYEMMKTYLNRFVKDSIYTIKDDIYIYNVKDKELIIKKYKRYNVIINENEVLHINCKNAKTNLIKDTYYLIIDTINNIFDLISDFLVQ